MEQRIFEISLTRRPYIGTNRWCSLTGRCRDIVSVSTVLPGRKIATCSRVTFQNSFEFAPRILPPHAKDSDEQRCSWYWSSFGL